MPLRKKFSHMLFVLATCFNCLFNKEARMILFFFKFCFSSRKLSKKKEHNSGNFLAVNLMLRELENATTEPMQLNEFTVSHPRARNVVITICFPERTNEKAFILLKAFFLSKNKKGKEKRKERSGSVLQLDSHSWNLTPAAPKQPPQMLGAERCRVNLLIFWEGTNIAQSFSHGDQVLRNIHWLQAHILHKFIFQTFISLEKLAFVNEKVRTSFGGELAGP